MLKDFYGKWVFFMDWAEWGSLSSLATSLIRQSYVGKIFFRTPFIKPTLNIRRDDCAFRCAAHNCVFYSIIRFPNTYNFACPVFLGNGKYKAYDKTFL